MISNFETENMEGYTVKVRTCNLKRNFIAPFYGWGSTASRLEPVRGDSQIHSCNMYLNNSKLTGKTEYAKHGKLNITLSKGQDNNITGQTASEQVFERTPFCYYSEHKGIQGTQEVGSRGVNTPHPLVSQLQEMV